jgi:hypothetical protein
MDIIQQGLYEQEVFELRLCEAVEGSETLPMRRGILNLTGYAAAGEIGRANGPSAGLWCWDRGLHTVIWVFGGP